MEVFSSQGRDPLHNTKVTNKKGVRKIYDKGVRGYVIYSSCTSASARLQLPRDDRRALKLSQPHFVIQVFVPVGQAFSIAMNIKDRSHTRRRLHFSSSFSDIKATPLHCQIPLVSLIRGKWLNLVLNVADFVSDNFPGQQLQCIDTLEIGGLSKVRKIFTLRDLPVDSMGGGGGAHIPRHLDYPVGVDVDTLILDSDSIKDNEGVQKLREATNQIRPLTEPLIKEIEQSSLSSSKAGQNSPVRIAFGTRFPAPKGSSGSPPKSRRSIGKGLEISISDEKAPSGPPSPVVKLPTVLSPRAKTAHMGDSLLESVHGRGRSANQSLYNRKFDRFDRTLPAPKGRKQNIVPLAVGRNSSKVSSDQGDKDNAKAMGDSEPMRLSVSVSQSLMQSSPPQQRGRKAYSKFRYSDHNNSPRGVNTSQQGPPQPLEDIPLNKQCTTSSSSQLSPQSSDFNLESSRSNWESLYTDQSMQTPGRQTNNRISLLPLSNQYDMFGDPGESKRSFDKRSHSHSKSDSMSSDTSERVEASQDMSREPGLMPVLRNSVEFKDADSGSSPNEASGSDRESEDLDYGLFNVNNTFNTPIPELQACPSEVLDEPVCIHDDDEEEEEEEEEEGNTSGNELPHSSQLDPLPKSFTERPQTSKFGERERGKSGKDAPDELHIDSHIHRTFDLGEIFMSSAAHSSNSEDDQVVDVEEEEEPADLVEVDELTKRQREMINKHRIFTPPVIPASKVYENDHFKPSLTSHYVGEQESLDDAEDGNTMMDLIYDPILNCYYDAKANRYYELK